MSTPNSESHSAHVDAVLEPITPSSRYEYVEIEQEPIGISNPFSRLKRVVPRWIRQGVSLFRKNPVWIVLAILALIAAELAIRTAEPRLMGRVYNASVTGGYPLAINNQGFRGTEVQIPKPDLSRRILALGDSVTMGTGVASESTWPAQLQRRINTTDVPVEVINTGLPALDLSQIELELRTRWAELEPDEIVVVITGNMISFAEARDGREIRVPDPDTRRATTSVQESGIRAQLKGLYTNLALPNALIIGSEHLKYAFGLEDHRYNPAFPVGVMLAHGYIQDGLGTHMSEHAYEVVGQQIAHLKHTADELGLPLTLVYAPPRFSLDHSIRNNLKFVDHDRLTIDPVERIGLICSELGIDFVDPRDSIREATGPAYVLSDYTHFSPSGHDALAAAIEKSIRNR